jgi:hypothetical protein
MKFIKKFLHGTKEYLFTSQDGSIIWLVQETWAFIKAAWKGIGERLNSLQMERDSKRSHNEEDGE